MANKELDFILASASPRRLALLAQLSIAPAAVIPAHIDETPQRAELPKDYVSRVAKQKAAMVASQQPHKNILAADTVVAMGRRIIPQPHDEATAAAMIHKLQGRRHRIYTAMVMVTADGKIIERISQTRVKLKPLNQQEIKNYIASQEWQGRTGGLALDLSAGAWCGWINGSYSNCLGLDLTTTYQLLKGVGLIT